MTSRLRGFPRGGRLLLVLLVVLAVIVLLVVVLAMLSFVFLPVVMQNMGSRRVSNPRVVTTTQYGDIHEFRLHRMRQNRQIVLGFLRQLQQAVMVAGGYPTKVGRAIQEIGTAGEEDVVDSWLLAHRAGELGLVINDNAINTYLNELMTAQKVPTEHAQQEQQIQQIQITTEQVQKILETFGISHDDLLDRLRPELMAVQLRKMFRVSLTATPPARRWGYFQRLNRNVTIEAAVIPVAGYVDEVANPDEATLREFFDRYKAKHADPASPEPGFREPQKVAVEYFKAEVETFVDPESITEEEIREEYESFKDDYYRRESWPPVDEVQSSEANPLHDSIVDADGPSVTRPPDQDEYLPLEEVEDEIRSRLARRKAQARIEEVLARLRAEMARYHDERILYQVESEESPAGEAPAPPPRPDFPDLAKQHGLTAHNTGLISALEALELDIGRSYIGGRIPFFRYAYDRLPEFRPATSQDIDGNHYLFWIIEDSEERVPEFEEEGVPDRVLRAWKMLRARSLARQEAERLVAEAGKAKQSLVDAFAGKPGIVVNQTEPFSWLTYGDIPPMWAQTPPRISSIKKRMPESAPGEQQEREAVVMPGDEFMRAVFDLEEGEIGTAMNQPKTAVYVVRVTETVPRADVLFRRFLEEDYIGYFRVAYYDQIESERAWLDEIKSSAGFRWNREPEPERRP